ncbi:MAG TPA: hypothetical protein VGR76_20995, partial [Candidatus Angelobacter sp.]|nr:hypothetical protein [Candidatus Angelobacter sp.]
FYLDGCGFTGVFGEGMSFVSGASWKDSGRSCRTDGNAVTLRTSWMLNQQVGFREDARFRPLEFNLRLSE